MLRYTGERMRERIGWKNLAALLLFAAIFTVVATGILYFCFPQFLYQLTYDVHESDLYEQEVREVLPGTVFTEVFSPEQPFVRAIGLHVKRESTDDEIVGRLYDESGKLIAQDSFRLRNVEYAFDFRKRLDTGRTYQLEILVPEHNENPVKLTFGPEGIGPGEHIFFQRGGIAGENQNADIRDADVRHVADSQSEILYMQYIYGTYSRKLLGLWVLVFAVTGLMLGESLLVLYRSGIELY